MKSFLLFAVALLLAGIAQAQEGQACAFNNQIVFDGSSVTAYQNSSVPVGSQCVSEVRTCSNGNLSGSFNFAACSPAQPASCLFNGQTIASGQSVTAYLNSSVAFGQKCVSQVETCNNGSFDGSYQYATCTIDAAAACLFDGQTIPDGQTITTYPSSSVPFGQNCTAVVETCNNGVLSGNNAFGSCTVNAPAACLFNGQTIASGQTIEAYQNSSVPFGQSCISQTETCTNGSFDGNYQFASCSVNAPASCLFNGATVASGQTVTAYPKSTVPYGQVCVAHVETCTNGILSGSDPYASCTVDAPASCLFNGSTLSNGQSVVAYQNSTVPYGQTCVSQVETCNNGAMSGNFNFSSCMVGAPAACSFNGTTVANGQSIATYPSSSVPAGQKCIAVYETCNNGVLSGTNQYSTCTVTTSSDACTFNGQVIPDDHSVVAYKTSHVAYDKRCISQRRRCEDGTLSGSYKYGSCTVDPDPEPGNSCMFNGRRIRNEHHVLAFKFPYAFDPGDPFHGHDNPNHCYFDWEIRECEHGKLRGHFKYSKCEGHPDDDDHDDNGGHGHHAKKGL